MSESRYDPRYDPRAPDEERPKPFAELPPTPPDVVPQGEVYDWYLRGCDLLDNGDTNAAVQLLSHCAQAEPESRAIREALARAQFNAGMYVESRENYECELADLGGLPSGLNPEDRIVLFPAHPSACATDWSVELWTDDLGRISAVNLLASEAAVEASE